MDIQISVPIYNAYAVTHAAIEALKKHNQDDDVLLIDDASTDPRIVDLLIDIPERWQVIRHTQNQGFVKTANHALRAYQGHSILLNSDTLVSQGWLQRFVDAIKCIPNLGTATPWSNNAEICSIPQTLTDNQIPDDLDHLATVLSAQHQAEYPDLPTAVGFCMLITAQAKQKVGYFDEQVFGLGYGEENDYSLRVAAQGLRNVLVDDCYVAHVGNQSFQERQLKPSQATMERLLSKHPNYLSMIEKFIENDPLKQLRESIVAKIAAF